MFSYNYSSRPTLIEPFTKIKLLQKGPLKLSVILIFILYPLRFPIEPTCRDDIMKRSRGM
jgi:hypothetical protein